MKKLAAIFLLFQLQSVFAQVYSAYNISLLAHLTPNTGDVGYDNRRYSGCWGWYQASKNKEYAIAGTSNGTYFYNITNPSSPVLCGFVQGAQGCTYREIKTFGHYAYIVSEDSQSNGIQIVDLQYLPDSIKLVYSGAQYFKRAHSIYISGNKMYLGSTTFAGGYKSMSVFSLATPTVPVLLRSLNDDYPFISTVHDMFVKGDTVYANSAYQGLYIFHYDSVANKFTQLGSYTGFPGAGYDHSSHLTSDNKNLVICEEIPAGLPIRIVNIENPTNVTPVSEVIPFPRTTPHNPFVKGNFALVSCYEDGLYIYDISNPAMPSRAGYFDTYNQGGANTGVYGNVNYRGNWGNYPYLPSGVVIANDMQNGVFILDATAAYTTTVKDYVGLATAEKNNSEIKFYPNPADKKLLLNNASTKNVQITVFDASGRRLLETSVTAGSQQVVDVSELADGIYFLQNSNENNVRKLVVHH